MADDSKPPLDRRRWLEEALVLLFEGGPQSLKIDRLARRLAVTRGSFYWHFRDLAHLQTSMVEWWREAQMAFVRRFSASNVERVEHGLDSLVAHIASKDPRQDIAMRAWALTNREAAAAVSDIDDARLRAVAAIFVELGWSKREAAFRAHAFYYHQLGAQMTAQTVMKKEKATSLRLLRDLLQRQ